jgi:hypothetical protein
VDDWSLPEKIAAVALPGLIAILWFITYLLRRSRDRKDAYQKAIKRQAARQAVAEKAAREKAMQATIAALQAETEQLALRRAAEERTAAERAAAEQAATELAIVEWIAAEEAESRRRTVEQAEQEKNAAKQTKRQHRVIDQYIAEWAAALQTGVDPAPTPHHFAPSPVTSESADIFKTRVVDLTQRVTKEADKLEFIFNDIQTQVDFLPIEVQETIDQWKKGEVYRYHTFEDLKVKFRYKAYSIRDGWDLLYRYNDWLARQRQALLDLLNQFSPTDTPSESIMARINSVEKAEWNKYPDMNMDIIFTLKEMRDIVEALKNIVSRLKDLETACKKRSAQVIRPPWDPNEPR